MGNNQIESTIKRLRNKLWLDRILSTFINVLVFASVVVFFFALLSHIVPVAYFLEKAARLFLGILVFGILKAIIKKPDLKTAALAGDHMGLFDRLSTYLEYRNNPEGIFQVFREEVEDFLDTFDPSTKYRIVFPWKRTALALVFIILTLSISVIPSAKNMLAREREYVHEELQEEAAKLNEISRKLEQGLKDNKHNSFEIDELIKVQSILDKLERELASSFNYSKAAMEVRNTRKELDTVFPTDFGLIEELSEKGTSKDDIDTVSGGSKGDGLSKTSVGKARDSDNAVLKNKDVSIDKIASNLAQMEERLLEKSDNSLREPRGDTNTRTAKDNSDMEREREAKDTMLSPEEQILGNAGDQARDQAPGKGGTAVDAGKNDKEKARGTGIEKKDPSRLGIETVEVTGAQGKEQKDQGVLSQSHTDRVFESHGDQKKNTYYYTEYDESDMEYVSKMNVPLEYRPMVSEYFKRLSEGK